MIIGKRRVHLALSSICLILIAFGSTVYSLGFGNWLQRKVLAPAVISSGLVFGGGSSNAMAADGGLPSRDIYFGVGCYWHVMHEFVQAEQNVLGRSEKQVTSAAGYGGSTKVAKNPNRPDDKNGVVCYHNLMGVGDYGSLGYGEVVGMELPKTDEVMRSFAKEYFSLFRNGDRPDLGDRGLEYRSLVGLPGGVTSPLYKPLEEEATKAGLKLMAGQGGDKDTSGKKMVWIYDSEQFPFKQGEIYHQFHDGFMPGEQYPQSYNSLAKEAFKDGRVVATGCPDSIPN